jgi:hypothetical protein
MNVNVSGGGHQSRSWCESCRDSNAFYCEGFDEYISDDNPSVFVEGMTYSQCWFDANGGYTCECDNREYLSGDTPKVEVIVDEHGTTEHWAVTNVQLHAFECEWDGNHYAKDLESDIFPGFPAAEDDNPAISTDERIDFGRSLNLLPDVIRDVPFSKPVPPSATEARILGIDWGADLSISMGIIPTPQFAEIVALTSAAA